ncbi:MAG: DNA-binding protein [Microbacterium sp.]
MREAELGVGRRWVLVLEPGEELIGALTAWCGRVGLAQGLVQFFGAFRTMSLIASRDEVADPERPLPATVETRYLEGVGLGSIAASETGTVVHLHASAGVKDQAAAAYAGHVTAAEVHYTTEVVVQEVTGPAMVLRPDARSYGLNCVFFDESAAGAIASSAR